MSKETFTHLMWEGLTLPQEPMGTDHHISLSSNGSQPEPSAGNPSLSSSAALESSFGANLEPVLRQVCQGRLSAVSWFRTDWQRGGAQTGYATYRDNDGVDQPVVVKLPIGPVEHRWLTRLGELQDVSPRIYADGQSLGGYDIAWVAMERLEHGPLSSAWDGKEFNLLIEAIGRFYAAASQFPIDQPPVDKDWQEIFDLSRQSVRRHGLADEQRWSKALKKAHRKLKEWISIWHDRSREHWCHGDLHLANAMTRVPAPDGPAVLLDFALTHPGHWVEDAIYFEHLYWSRRKQLRGRKLSKLIAQQRKKQGMKVAKDWSRLASVKRALLAMSTPAVLRLDGDRQHVQAALEVLEAEVDSG